MATGAGRYGPAAARLIKTFYLFSESCDDGSKIKSSSCRCEVCAKRDAGRLNVLQTLTEDAERGVPYLGGEALAAGCLRQPLLRL